MAAGRWVGRGDKEGGDGAAVDAMRELVNSVSMRGVVVIGEGEKTTPRCSTTARKSATATAPNATSRSTRRRHHPDEQRACRMPSRCWR